MDKLLPTQTKQQKNRQKENEKKTIKRKKGKSPQKHTQTQKKIKYVFNLLKPHAATRTFLSDIIY